MPAARWSVALHPTDPQQVVIGARYAGEVFAAQDGGETWAAMPLPGAGEGYLFGGVR